MWRLFNPPREARGRKCNSCLWYRAEHHTTDQDIGILGSPTLGVRSAAVMFVIAFAIYVLLATVGQMYLDEPNS